MAEIHQDSGGGGDFDLSQFYQIFFEEAGENYNQTRVWLTCCWSLLTHRVDC